MSSDLLLKGKENSDMLFFITITQCPSLKSLLEIEGEECGETKTHLIKTLGKQQTGKL